MGFVTQKNLTSSKISKNILMQNGFKKLNAVNTNVSQFNLFRYNLAMIFIFIERNM